MALIIITGPTATGKTSLGVDLARHLDGEIISADSRQLYRGMDLGTGKDLDEYGDMPYHLIDIAPAGYRYNLFEYLRDFQHVRADIEARGRQPIVIGGTGLYVESILKGIKLPEVPANPELRQQLEKLSLPELSDMLARMKRLHNTTDVDTAKRAIRAIEIETYYQEHPERAAQTQPCPITNALTFVVDIDRDTRRKRIEQRLDARLSQGMVEEVKALLASGLAPEDLEYYGLEYKFLTQYVTGRIDYDTMRRLLLIAIHQFAKRQMTWFRGMERRGFKPIHIPYDINHDEFNAMVNDMLDRQS